MAHDDGFIQVLVAKVNANKTAYEKILAERNSLRKMAQGARDAGMLTQTDLKVVNEVFPPRTRTTKAKNTANK